MGRKEISQNITSATAMINTDISNEQNIKTDTVEVLYQKMGDRWFAFSLIDDEVFVGSITQEEINSPNA